MEGQGLAERLRGVQTPELLAEQQRLEKMVRLLQVRQNVYLREVWRRSGHAGGRNAPRWGKAG
jgi:hypothetical protein